MALKLFTLATDLCGRLRHPLQFGFRGRGAREGEREWEREREREREGARGRERASERERGGRSVTVWAKHRLLECLLVDGGCGA